MKIKKVEVKGFKRFTNLIVEDIPETARLIVLVGSNGCGKTSFLESLHHFQRMHGGWGVGDFDYLVKGGGVNRKKPDNYWNVLNESVNVSFYGNKTTLSENEIRKCFYFMGAYRNESDFHISSMSAKGNPVDTYRLQKLIENDKSVSDNYERIVSLAVSDLCNDNVRDKTVEEVREKLLGKIKSSLNRVFEDLQLTSIGNPFENGTFYFQKGIVKDFRYENLSAGEKSAFDLILDLVVQSQYYPDAIYCIDEPEIHMHTKLQGQVLRELYLLTPETSQLIVATHSIGMLEEARKIEQDNKGTVVFLNFNDKNFDDEQVIVPAKISKSILEKFYEIALGDFGNILLPSKIVFCEGSNKGRTRKNFDQEVYSIVFENEFPDTIFVSWGACSEIESLQEKVGSVINVIFKGTKIIKLVDRDARTDEEVDELESDGVRVTSERNIEGYLLSDEIIKKYCHVIGRDDALDECLKLKSKALEDSVNRGNPVDDLKSIRCNIYGEFKKILNLTRAGNSPDAFMRFELAPLITPETKTYLNMRKDVFGV